MKTRQGFVSNSSSSSFVVIATKEQIDNSISELSTVGKALIKEEILYGAKTENINGQEFLLTFGEMSTEDFGSVLYSHFGIEDYWEEAENIWYDFKNLVNKNGGIVREQ